MFSWFKELGIKIGTILKFGDRDKSPTQKINIKNVGGGVEAKNVTTYKNEGANKERE